MTSGFVNLDKVVLGRGKVSIGSVFVLMRLVGQDLECYRGSRESGVEARSKCYSGWAVQVCLCFVHRIGHGTSGLRATRRNFGYVQL